MRIADILSQRQTFSFEIFPPRGDMSVEQAMDIAGSMAQQQPDWISVTFSAGGSGNVGATGAIAAELQRRTRINALAHLTCLGSSEADVDAFVNGADQFDDMTMLCMVYRGREKPEAQEPEHDAEAMKTAED